MIRSSTAARCRRADAALDQPFAQPREGIEVDTAEAVRGRQRGADAAHPDDAEGHDTLPG
jgi:hypothetical protein